MAGTHGNIDIQPAELRGLAKNIGDQRDALNRQFEEMDAKMGNLEKDGWDSNTGRELRRKFGSLYRDYLNKYPPAMDSYMNFLNQTADDYERTERDRSADIDKLKDKIN